MSGVIEQLPKSNGDNVSTTSSTDSLMEVDPPATTKELRGEDTNPTSSTTTTQEDASFLTNTRRQIQEKAKSVLETAGQLVGRRRLRSGNSVDGNSATASNTAAGGCGSSSSSTAASIPGEEEVTNLMNIAEYEIHQDPYRGILSLQQSLETGTTITTPWNACEWGTLPPEPLSNPVTELQDPQVMVRHVVNCACPSLKEWTRTLLIERSKKKSTNNNNNNNKKRKRNSPSSSIATSDDENQHQQQKQQLFMIGVRPTVNDYECQCDYNPLCLATLGGVVDDVMRERCHDLNQALPSTETKEQPVSSPLTVAKFFKSVAGNRKMKQKDNDDDNEVQIVDQGASKKKSDAVEVVDLDQPITSKPRSTFQDPAFDDTDAEGPFEFLDQADAATSSSSNNQIETNGGWDVGTWCSPVLKPATDSFMAKEEDPADIFTTSSIPQQDYSSIKFSRETNDALHRARHCVEVDTPSIRTYVHQTLRVEPCSLDDDVDGDGDDNALTIDKYMKVLKDWHQNLQFSNPLLDDRNNSSGDRMTLTMPPGISNLGATCYLNTQLQCLAQNLTFLTGIFAWRMVDETHQMNLVMTKLQKLLAEMFLGGHRKLTTFDFSNSLGLEHHEQQDPNEFARLLFDRMDESFQQCDNGGELSNLLTKIFHGVTTYETVCLTCGHASERSEGFMDLNLPIVKPTKEDKKRSTGNIEEAFAFSTAQNVDTDVQYCLDQYTCTERLEGDNQYLCSKCNCKRDAKRILKLTELPPVLNVQLSRYVFDRSTFTKKKVSDKVLLPSSLTVQTGCATKKKKYLLCAVMRHQGNSAYSGHYIAEAMDWLTGKWFEFNDENVKLLPDGPSCSFDPEAAAAKESMGDTNGKGTTTKARGSTPSGSQDAYNMYYVDEDYLSKSAQKAIHARAQLVAKGPNAGEVLDDVTDDRIKIFQKLAELCLNDAQISDRLNRRKLGIRKYMVPNAQALVRQPNGRNTEGGAWVSSELLMGYFQCEVNPHIESLLHDHSSNPILEHATLLCGHKCLPPEKARRGKLLPITMYKALISLLRGEHALLQPEFDSSTSCNGTIVDHEIISNRNLACQECSSIYREDLEERLDLLGAAKDLYDALETKNGDDVSVEYEEHEEPKCEADMHAYVLSRQTATKFRKRIASVIKQASKVECGGPPGLPTAGIGAIDLGPICHHVVARDGSHKFGPQPTAQDPVLDKYFNSNITCSHGNCPFMHKKQQVRYVSLRVWRLIRKFFPDAFEHKVKREPRNGTKGPELDNQGCPNCAAEKASVEGLRGALQAWATATQEHASLKRLLQWRRSLSRDQEVLHFANARDGCRLAHREDIKTWRETVKALLNAQKLKGDSCEELRANVERLAFPTFHKVVLDFEKEPVDTLVGSIRSYICSEHHLAVRSAILITPSNSDGTSTPRLADHVTVVGHDEYRAYIQTLATLLRILRSDRARNSSLFASPIAVDEEKAFVKQIFEVARLHHPIIQTPNGGSHQLRFALEGTEKTFTLLPGICDHDTCKKECAPLLVSDDKDDDKIERISLDSFGDAKPSGKKSSPASPSGPPEPILVESDAEDENKTKELTLRIFGVKSGSTKEQVIESLHESSGILSDVVDTSHELRRSTRKRKARYPCGVLLRENSVKVRSDHNLATICLRMLEDHNILVTYNKVYLVVTPQFETPAVMETDPVMPGRMDTTLENLLSELRNGKPDDDHFNSKAHVLLFYQQGTWTETDTKVHERREPELWRMANFVSETPDPNSTGRAPSGNARPSTKSRPSERGFSGTLLQSGGRPPAPTESTEANADDDSVIQGKPATSTISDEDLHEGPQPSIVVDDLPASRPSSRTQDYMDLHGESDDDDVLKRGCTFEREKDRQASVSAKEAKKQTIDDEFVRRVTCMLEHILKPRSIDPVKLWDAVFWAHSNNPDIKEDSALLDFAYAKYLDLTEGNSSM